MKDEAIDQSKVNEQRLYFMKKGLAGDPRREVMRRKMNRFWDLLSTEAAGREKDLSRC